MSIPGIFTLTEDESSLIPVYYETVLTKPLDFINSEKSEQVEQSRVAPDSDCIDKIAQSCWT